jgi:Lrp/AsnC family transcriptional regulator
MLAKFDRIDREILSILQEDCTLPVADIAQQVGLSTTPCWRRIQRLEKDGVIVKRVALLNPAAVNAGVTALVAIKTNQHNDEWFNHFKDAVSTFSEVVEFYRMAGEIDYLLRVVVPDIERFDQFYKRLITKVALTDVSTSFAMEQIKYTSSLPLDFVDEKPLDSTVR